MTRGGSRRDLRGSSLWLHKESATHETPATEEDGLRGGEEEFGLDMSPGGLGHPSRVVPCRVGHLFGPEAPGEEELKVEI